MFPGPSGLHNALMKGSGIALCAAIDIGGEGASAPEWLHLLPAGVARTVDGRGPYKVADAAALMSASMAGGKLTICENHATDLAAPKGGAAPARGWIVDMQSRDDGIWGKVDWVEGEGVPAWRQYRGLSPVIAHSKDGTVSAILRASLTNTPNLTGLQSLHHQENDMALRDELIGALGLDSAADDAAIVAAVTAGKTGGAIALQAALKPIALAVGVAENADAATVLAGVQAFGKGDDDRVTSLQSEVATLTTSLDSVTTERKRDKATAFVDGAIGAGRVGLKPCRDEYISMHMAEPAKAEKLINAMPILAPGATALTGAAPEGAPENPALLSQKAAAHQAKLAAEGTVIDFATAVRAVAGENAA